LRRKGDGDAVADRRRREPDRRKTNFTGGTQRACLDRIARVDVQLRSFLLVTEERALEDTRAAEARIMSNGPKGPLDGIPIGHKDIYKTAGIRTTGNSRLLADNVRASDAAAVSRLAEAGTVMPGKLTNSEFATGAGYDLPWPSPRNPWDLDRATGGSSSGTGAAVAAGLILGGTGTETAGSICAPSALCGITGIKPTYGRVSRAGVLPLAFSLDHAGPMAWTAEDWAFLLQAMAGHDPSDPPAPTSLCQTSVPDWTWVCEGYASGWSGISSKPTMPSVLPHERASTMPWLG
jgi:aspartyl-tRNA(Asn)/glutamyl-tRNA(Gln) amidotransferase subunit A